MSFLSESGCGTCKLRSKRCDRTWGPAGCRQCAEEGLECRRRIPKLKNSVRNVGAIDNNRPGPTVIPATVASASLPTSQCQANSSPICGDGRSQRQYTGQHPHGSASHGRVYLSSTKSAYTPSTIPNRQAPTPPAEATGSVHKSTSPPSLAIICKTPHVNNSAQLLTPVSPGFSANTNRERGPHAESGPSLIADSHLIYRPGSPPDYEEDDPENIQEVLFSTLSLDRDVESNTVPYVAQSIAIGAIRFVFMPTQLLLRFQGYISQRCSLGREARQRMVLLANVSTAISGTTQYDLKDYRIFHKQLINRIHHARICNDLEKDIALQVLEMSHELLSTMWKVGSLADFVSTMHLYAPIFRRACPESDQELVNFSRLLITPNFDLQYYASLDILQSFITHRPMFFRYDLNFLSPQVEELIKREQGIGLCWVYGVPNHLLFIIARMNMILEDYGSAVDRKTVEEIENAIETCTTLLPSGTTADPVLNMGRIMVQESWKLAAYVYLYMGVCGADSSDARVTRVLKRFMRALTGITPSRNPDSFLVLPMAILGIATSAPKDQTKLLNRLLGVFECTKPGTVANNIVMILRDVWLRTIERPTVWADLRIACLRVIGI